jgi:predicted dehydrogenase
MVSPRFAIVGTGSMAATMATVFLKAGVPVTAVVSRSPERAATFAKMYGIGAGKSDLSAVLARADVDAIYVANAPSEHAETVVAAIRSGKPVLCEKPMATSEAELRKVVRSAEQSKVLCMEAIWTLCLPAYRRFLECAHSGDWGEPRSLNASFAYPSSDADRQRADAANRGGVLLDRSIYLIALALSVLGPVNGIDAKLGFNSSGTDIEAFLQLEHATGTHSQLASSFTCLMPNTAALHCSRGLIEIKAPLIGAETLSTVAAQASYGAGYPLAPPTTADRIKNRLRESPHIRSIKRALDRPSSQHLAFGSDGYLPQLSHFLTLLKTKKTQSDIVPLALSLESIQIIDKVRKLVTG